MTSRKLPARRHERTSTGRAITHICFNFRDKRLDEVDGLVASDSSPNKVRFRQSIMSLGADKSVSRHFIGVSLLPLLCLLANSMNACPMARQDELRGKWIGEF